MLHRIRRFFATLSARSLSASERATVSGWLTNEQTEELFFQQPKTDQRHSYACGAFVLAQTDRPEMVQAAVLHDIGKRHVGFGWIRRTVAGVCQVLGVDLGGNFRLYTAHGQVGADELDGLGVHPLVVEFARAHHGDRPVTISENDWSVLLAADNER